MVEIVKHTTRAGNIEFEFSGAEYWEDFDIISQIITDKFKACVVSELVGIYSKYSIYILDSIEFKLMYHEDTGNCLCPTSLSERSINYVKDLAYKIAPLIEIQLGDIK